MKWLMAAVLFLPLVAVADSIDFVSGGQGSDVTVVGSIKAGASWSVTDDLTQINNLTTGKNQLGAELGTVDITSGTLFACNTGLCFNGGSVVVKSETGSLIFDGMFSSGTITTSGGNTFLNASLKNGGTAEIKTTGGVFSSNTAISSTVPEPSSLLMLGAGLIGLASQRRLIHGWKKNG